MKCTVFAKTRQTHDGRKFSIYVSKLLKHDGTEQYVTIKFPQDNRPAPGDCPLIIDIDKGTANMSKRKIVDAVSGEDREIFTLWVQEWKPTGEKWVDHSLDEFV